jgi:ferredoxin
MRVTVDREICCSYGCCVETVPQVFSFDAQTKLVIAEKIPEGLHERVRFACGACPASALTTED